MRTVDVIKRWLAKPAFCTQSTSGDYGTGGPDPLGRSTGTAPPDRRYLRILLFSERQGDQGRASEQVVSIRSARSHPLSNNEATCSHEPATTTVHEAITRLLHRVDWASLRTLSRYIGINQESITHHLRELEEQGKVGIGQRLVPPEMRTVAWLTDNGRSRSGCEAYEAYQQTDTRQADEGQDVKARR